MIKFTKGKKIKKSVALMLIGVVYTTSIYSVRALSRKVDVNVDNSTISTMTLNSDTDRILNQVGVKLGSNDSVERYDEVDGSLKLDVKRAFDVNVFKDDQKIMLKKSSGTVKDVLDELQISEKDRDTLNFSESQELFADISIVVGKKFKVTINADGETKEYFAPEGSVNDTLNYLGIPFSSEDLIDADVSSNIYDGLVLTINRITYREVEKTEDIPFKTEVKRSNLLNDCDSQVSRAGRNGSREITVREKLKDGEVIDSKEINSKIISQPINEIVIKGTKQVPGNDNVKPSGSKRASIASDTCSGKRCISGSATAYTASRGARTSTGTVPVEGVTIAVDPHLIPYGSKVKVVSNDGKVLWNGIASDTGGALRSGRAVVDIYMNSTMKCMKFGRKPVKVYY